MASFLAQRPLSEPDLLQVVTVTSIFHDDNICSTETTDLNLTLRGYLHIVAW